MHELDAASVLHLRMFALHLAIILLSAAPAVLVDPRWCRLWADLACTFGACASGLAVMAASCRLAWPRRRLCLWDEAAALGALCFLSAFLARQSAA